MSPCFLFGDHEDDAFASVELDHLIPRRTETYEGAEDCEEDETIGPQINGVDSKQSTKTTVTVEAFSVDHSVLTDNPPRASASHSSRSRSGENRGWVPPTTNSSSEPTSNPSRSVKKKKVGKIPYESKATRSIDRAKKQRKREEKSSGKSKVKKRSGPVKRG